MPSAPRVRVCSSTLDRTWRRQYRASRGNRLRQEVRLSELDERDIEFFEGREDVHLTPEHHAGQAVNRYITVDTELLELARLLRGRGIVQRAWWRSLGDWPWQHRLREGDVRRYGACLRDRSADLTTRPREWRRFASITEWRP